MWKILNRVEQEIYLTYLQTKHFLFCGGGRFFSFTLPKHFCVFSGKICCNETTASRDMSGGHGSSFDGQRVEQEISLTYLQTRHFLFRGGGGFFSFTLPKHFCIISGNETTALSDLMQRDDDAERSVRWQWILLRCARQEPVKNPKQSRARDFPHLPPNQTLPLPRRRRLLLLHSPEALLHFLRQRDDGAERSDATR
ncbi:uncharacterized protein G2W53_015215 [Senna tora]|uniref:Uncharacterized protein n=1 Tax=Senna tora TaxID=362788 RepID=A0A834WV50_9FABA|nr:uncharacterized protein G2W53_015215 [Senna tora]